MQTTKVFDVFKQISFCGRCFYCFLFCFSHAGFLVHLLRNYYWSEIIFSNFFIHTLLLLLCFFVSYNWDINVTECKWLWSVRFTAQLQHTYWCILPILPDNHESTNNCSTDSQSLLCTALCDLIWRGKHFIFFVLFIIMAKLLFLFIIDFYSSGVFVP